MYHSGAIPGFSLLVAFLPRDNLGAVILANMDEKYDETLDILYRVVDEALGLPVHTTPRSSQSEPQPTPPTQHDSTDTGTEPLPLALEAYAGTYRDSAYGDLTLCVPSSTSKLCADVLEAFAPIDAPGGLSSWPNDTLYAAFPSVWSTHIRLRHTAGGSFAVTLPALFPHGYGRNTTPFEYYESQVGVGRAEFVSENGGAVVGFALITEEQAAIARARRNGGEPREVGDAWFVKV